jgi:hypothetical protein
MKWTAMTILAFGALTATNAPNQDPIKEVNPVPFKFMPPEGHVMLCKAKAVGVQIDSCKAEAGHPDRFEWVVKAPDAELFDEGGQRIGRRLAGPTREVLEDGSKVVGTLIQTAHAPKGGDIPWLLLKGKADAGKGRFGKVAYIQRVENRGGRRPLGRTR